MTNGKNWQEKVTFIWDLAVNMILFSHSYSFKMMPGFILMRLPRLARNDTNRKF